jgi:hypothetical protein
LAQQELQPAEETPEVVAGGGEDGVGGVALAVPEIVPAHSMLGFEVADHRLMLLAQSGAEATILTSLTRSWKIIANQTDRYVAIMKKEAAQKK